MRLRSSLVIVWLAALALWPAGTVRAVSPETLGSVVSVLPVWPDRPPPGTRGAPEGSGVAVRPGVVATAWHVIAPADSIDVRLSDGRLRRARLLAFDAATDIALLSVDAPLAPFALATEPGLAQPVCAIGNGFGLGLSVSCGVVSALGVSNAGFNAVEDFVQTDAAINPGFSGGALVDAQGQLVGMVSAIFASQGDTNIGINFAVSASLLERVTEALIAGDLRYPDPGWQLQDADRETRARIAAPRIAALAPGGAAQQGGLRVGDLVLEIAGRRVRSPRDAVGALAHVAQGAAGYDVRVERDGGVRRVTLDWGAAAEAQGPPTASRPQAPATVQQAPQDPVPPGPDLGAQGPAIRDGAPARETPLAPDADAARASDCPYAADVCVLRQAVFPVSSFDPLASATRIGPDLVVTNRHVVGDRREATLLTPDGPRQARVIASDYTGDLVLLRAEGLPADGHVPALTPASDLPGDAAYFVVGADVARAQVRVFEPGALIAGPSPGAPLGRVHVTAKMQPGVSGGALVDATGALAGIAVGGGDGRFEAIPVAQVRALLEGQEAPGAERITQRLGDAFAACSRTLEAGSGDPAPDERPGDPGAAPGTALLAEPCAQAMNQGQLLRAGRLLAQAGAHEEAIALHGAAVRQVPGSINARLSLLVSLQLGARFADMVPHARWLLERGRDLPQAMHIAVRAGVWGGDADLAEAGVEGLRAIAPGQAAAARRFIDAAPPAPGPR